MFSHSLTFIALLSFSIVSHSAAIPMDADQAVMDANHNALLHKDVAEVQGGDYDKDVAEAPVFEATDSCSAVAECLNGNASVIATNSQKPGDWFVVQESSSALQPLAVLLLIIGLIVFFLSRKSTSTK